MKVVCFLVSISPPVSSARPALNVLRVVLSVTEPVEMPVARSTIAMAPKPTDRVAPPRSSTCRPPASKLSRRASNTGAWRTAFSSTTSGANPAWLKAAASPCARPPSASFATTEGPPPSTTSLLRAS